MGALCSAIPERGWEDKSPCSATECPEGSWATATTGVQEMMLDMHTSCHVLVGFIFVDEYVVPISCPEALPESLLLLGSCGGCGMRGGSLSLPKITLY